MNFIRNVSSCQLFSSCLYKQFPGTVSHISILITQLAYGIILAFFVNSIEPLFIYSYVSFQLLSNHAPYTLFVSAWCLCVESLLNQSIIIDRHLLLATEERERERGEKLTTTAKTISTHSNIFDLNILFSSPYI